MRSRLAPSPTGALHIGNARTFLLTWLHVRAAGGTLLLRIDDLDGPRVKRGASAAAVEDLRWLGLDWDEEPRSPGTPPEHGDAGPGLRSGTPPEQGGAGPGLRSGTPPERGGAGPGWAPVLVQSERAAVYDEACARLGAAGLAYPCVCTRTEVESAASAPHGPEGPRYPGTCRGRWKDTEEATRATGKPTALRFAAPPGPVPFEDLLAGPQAFDPSAETGDFVIRKANGTAAYQLATVVDDAATAIDLVIRGADLLPSTSRQILLARALGVASPAYLHLPLVVGPDGRRLAKRHGDTSIAHLRRLGWSAAQLVGRLAETCGLAGPGEGAMPRDLLPRYDPAKLSREPVTVDGSRFAAPPARPSG